MADVTNIPSERVNIKCLSGTDLSFVLTYTDSAGDPINLSGYSSIMRFKRNYITSTVDLELENGSGITLGGAAGTVTVALTAAQTALLSGEYAITLDIESSGGVIATLAIGVALFTKKATP